jgi:hypothetical protein
MGNLFSDLNDESIIKTIASFFGLRIKKKGTPTEQVVVDEDIIDYEDDEFIQQYNNSIENAKISSQIALNLSNSLDNKLIIASAIMYASQSANNLNLASKNFYNSNITPTYYSESVDYENYSSMPTEYENYSSMPTEYENNFSVNNNI